MAEDESVAEDQTGALANWDRLNAWKNDWIKTPGSPDIMLQPADFEGDPTDRAASKVLAVKADESGLEYVPNGSVAANGGLLAVMTWDAGGSEYVWPGGSAPDASLYDFIRFRGPEDPTTADGGRDVTGDEWLDTGV
jgi:hypothetical protein